MVTLADPAARDPKLTVLSFGAGQDSTAILYMLAYNTLFRRLWAPRDLLVIMADTGNEFPDTYLHVRSVQKFCEAHGIEFVFVTKQLGFHNHNWQSLQEYFARYDLIMSKVFRKTCTDQLKIQPLYRYLNAYVAAKYGYEPEGGTYRSKRALVEFAAAHGPVRMLIGIARGEEGRLNEEASGPTEWMRRAVGKAYPLVWLKWDRAACQDYIRRQGHTVPPPSNCMMCPFMGKIELLWLARRHPEAFHEWCGYEKRKLAKCAGRAGNNVGALHATKTLPEVLADAEDKYGHMTMEELEEYRFSHGHCVKSKY